MNRKHAVYFKYNKFKAVLLAFVTSEQNLTMLIPQSFNYHALMALKLYDAF